MGLFGNWPVMDGSVPAPRSHRDDRRLLFVCTGNIARSAAAELLAQQRYSDLGLEYESAGVGSLLRDGVARDVRHSLEQRGVDGSQHGPRQFNDAIARESGLILVMERAHRSWILDEWPDLVGRVALLREAAAIATAWAGEPADGTATPLPGDEQHGRHGRRGGDDESMAERLVRACTHGVEFEVADPFRQGTAAGEVAVSQIELALDSLLPWYARSLVR